MPPKSAEEAWHLDKKVPIALIVVLIAQFLGGLWFMARLDSRVEEQAARIAKTEAQINTIDREARDFGTRIARIEEKTSSMLTILQRIERFIDGNRRTDLP